MTQNRRSVHQRHLYNDDRGGKSATATIGTQAAVNASRAHLPTATGRQHYSDGYMRDFNYLATTLPTVVPISESEPIYKERQSQFIRIRSMSRRELQVWKVCTKVDEPINIRAVYTADTIVGQRERIKENECGRVVIGTLAGTLAAGGLLQFNGDAGSEYFYTPVAESLSDSAEMSITGRFFINDNATQHMYVVYDDQVNYKASEDDEDLLARERAFMDSYIKDTGDHWRHYYGYLGERHKPRSFMWPPHITAGVTSKARYWTDKLVQESDDVRLTVRAVSAEPRIFVIEDFLSSYEVASLINLAKGKLERSLVGNFADGGSRESHVRTSSNTWLRRSSSLLLETVFDRAADVMGVPRAVFAVEANAVEDLQVVYYRKGQKYNAHHDWSVSNNAPHSRFATLLIYLSDMPSDTAGGETAFPKARTTSSGDQGESLGTGIKIRPKSGMAALFYNLLEDGNGDELSLHAALPVQEGEKWLANLWLWD